MFNLPILESWLDKEVAAGYTWGNILEYWWVGLIILIVAAAGLVGAFVLLKLVTRERIRQIEAKAIRKLSIITKRLLKQKRRLLLNPQLAQLRMSLDGID